MVGDLELNFWEAILLGMTKSLLIDEYDERD
jgi:hypothetical protein